MNTIKRNKVICLVILSVVLGTANVYAQDNASGSQEELVFWSSNAAEKLEVKYGSMSFTVKQQSASNNKMLCHHTYTISNVAEHDNLHSLLFDDPEIHSIEVTYNQQPSSPTPMPPSSPGHRQPSSHPNSPHLPLLSVVVDYAPTSVKVVTEHYSTVKQMSLNDTASLCKSVEPLIGHPLLPLSSQSPLSSLVYMGLVPRDLDAPRFNNAQLTTSNSAKQRFFQQQIDFSLGGMMSSLSLLRQRQPSGNLASYISQSLSSKHIIRSIKLIKNPINGQTSLQFSEVIEISTSKIDVIPSSPTAVYTETNTHKTSYDINTGIETTELHNNQAVSSDYSATIIAREARKQGFHRELYTSMQLNNNNKGNDQCSILLLEHFDQGAFVDRYEVDELKRFGGPSVYLYQLIDLEKPSYTSTQNFVSVSKPISSSSSSSPSSAIEITLPFHLRYQNPGTTISRVSTVLPPVIFVKCGNDHTWHRASITQEVPTLHIETPVGQLGVKSFVTMSTLLVTVIGSLIVIIAIIYKSKINIENLIITSKDK